MCTRSERNLRAVLTLQQHAHLLGYTVLFNSEDSARYVPQNRMKCILLVRGDIAIDQNNAICLHSSTAWNFMNVCPTPPTVEHRGVYHGHPLNNHTMTAKETIHDLSLDAFCHIVETQLQCLCTKNRSNFHSRPPRFGQWLLDDERNPHWIFSLIVCAFHGLRGLLWLTQG